MSCPSRLKCGEVSASPTKPASPTYYGTCSANKEARSLISSVVKNCSLMISRPQFTRSS